MHLGWDAIGVPQLAGYHLYRSTTAGVLGTDLTPGGLATTSYDDNAVSNGTTYYYRLKWQASDGLLSGPSNEVSATPAVPVNPVVKTSAIPGGQQGIAYVTGLEAESGVPPYTWSISAGALPAGVALDPATGLLSGTPTTIGTAGFTVKVTDSTAKQGTKAFSLPVTTAQSWPQPGRNGTGSAYAPAEKR
ncbi:MAG: Ig domain-containing protein [Acidimicrobiales bacterium]